MTPRGLRLSIGERVSYVQADFTSLEGKLERLDFSLAAIESAIRGRFDLAGCSYCQVAGNVAVHFNVIERKTGKAGCLVAISLKV